MQPLFFPSPEPPLRFSGKQSIQKQFDSVFAQIRIHSSATERPFHQLEPHDLLVQIVTAETALVSFHLLNPERIARRTLFLTQSEGGWRIQHLHASNVPR
jgi:ketosteroid isomerase-like protein